MQSTNGQMRLRAFYKWQADNTISLTIVKSFTGSSYNEVFNHLWISSTMQLMDDHTGYSVGINAVKGAAKLCNYFKQTAFKVLDVLNNANNNINTLSPKHQLLFAALPDTVTTNQAIEIGSNMEDGTGKQYNSKFVTRLLRESNLFEKLAHGTWRKTSK